MIQGQGTHEHPVESWAGCLTAPAVSRDEPAWSSSPVCPAVGSAGWEWWAGVQPDVMLGAAG